MPRQEDRNWLGVLLAAKARGISLATVAEEQGVSPAGVARACSRHSIFLPDGRRSRWAGKTHLRRNEVAPG